MKTLRDVGVRPLLPGILLWVFVRGGWVYPLRRAVGLTGQRRRRLAVSCLNTHNATFLETHGQPIVTNCSEEPRDAGPCSARKTAHSCLACAPGRGANSHARSEEHTSEL